jgi:hypothetical protein
MLSLQNGFSRRMSDNRISWCDLKSIGNRNFALYNGPVVYDLMVHLDEDGDPVLEAHTTQGREFLDKEVPGHEGRGAYIVVTKEEFIHGIPTTLTVGFTHAGQTQKLVRGVLH